MLNLLRMDLYRMFRSKSFYICFGIILFIAFFTFGFLFVITSPDAQEFLLTRGMSLADFEGDTGFELLSFSILDIFHQSSISGGFFSVTIGILASLFVGVDFENGFIKNIVCAHENKWTYVTSKLCCLSIVNMIYLAGSLLLTILLNILLGGIYSNVPAASILFYLVAVWLVACAFSAMALMIIIVTRSKSVGIALAIFVNGGVILQILSLLLGLFNLKWLTEYTLYYSLAGMKLPPRHLADVATALLIAAVYLIIYTLVGKLALAKKDI